jgi:hypothetical protein
MGIATTNATINSHCISHPSFLSRFSIYFTSTITLPSRCQN